MTVTVLHNQSLLDIAVRYCGTAMAAFDIAVLNGYPVSAEMPIGTLLEIPSEGYGKNEIVSYFNRNSHQPATAWNKENSMVQPQPEGISFWAINFDFEVQ